MNTKTACVVVGAILLLSGNVRGQHLWWNLEKQDKAVCLYGEITVLATHPAVYYCGANWHPGEAAGGYCGIQDNSPTERRTIFSIWDTSPTLHPQTTKADPQTVFNRFGGEGEGAHSHMPWDWKVGDTFQFFVRKQPGAAAGTTDAAYYIFDRKAKKWRHSATITCPNGDKKTEASVATIGGGAVASFLENYLGKDRDIAKLALYRLWLGNDLSTMKSLTRARRRHLGPTPRCLFPGRRRQQAVGDTLRPTAKALRQAGLRRPTKNTSPHLQQADPPQRRPSAQSPDESAEVNWCSEQPPLHGSAEQAGVVAGIAKAIDKTLRAVRAIDHPRPNAADRLEQLVVVGVVRKRQSVIDPEPVLRSRVNRPASHGNAKCAQQKKGVRSNLPERPSGCLAQIGPDPFFSPGGTTTAQPGLARPAKRS